MRPLPRSLQGRLLVLVLGAVAFAWLLAALLTWRGAQHELDELLDAHLAQAGALLVAQQADDDDEERHVDSPSLHRYAPRVAFQVWRGDRLVLHSANASTAPMAPLQSGYTTLNEGGTQWRVFAAQGGGVQVYVGERIDARREILRAVTAGLFGPLLLALPLLALLVWWATLQALRPLRRLRAALAQRTPEQLHPLDVDRTPTELGGLVHALNALFLRIGQLIEGERRFTADAAHELRTPIAAVRAQAEVALAATDENERRHALQATLEGCDRAAHLVQQLLMLSRLEAEGSPAPQRLNLAAACRRVVAQLAPQALRKRQALQLDAPDELAAAIDETLFGVLLRNLVDNAIRYSPEGGTVQIMLRGDEEAWMLSVEDSGPGLDPAQQARLGERFFRVLGNDAPGSGLGWSIVRRIAQVLHLRLGTARSPLGGLLVNVATLE